MPTRTRRLSGTRPRNRLCKTRAAEIMAEHVLADIREFGGELDLARVVHVLATAETGAMGGWVAAVARNANERTTLAAARRLSAAYVDPTRLPRPVHLTIPGELATDAALANLRTHLDATSWSWLAEEITAQVGR